MIILSSNHTKLMPTPVQIADYKKISFSAPIRTGQTLHHDVYIRGAGSKVLVLIQELPGIGQETLALADQFVDQGYIVYLPHLFGPLGKTSMVGNTVRVLCMRKEFSLFSANASSPIVDWLKALCIKVKADNGVKGVATIGMCLTGTFALALMADDSVLASYASQPALPIFNQKGLHLSEEEIDRIKLKLDDLEPMHCARFKKDKLCTKAKFEAIDLHFNQDKQRVKLHEIPGKGHSVFTLDFDKGNGQPQAILQEVMAYFDRSLS